MKNEYSFEHFQKRREDIKNRNSKTKKTLLRLFVTTFSIVLFSFLVLAALMSPNLNIPALNDDKDNVSDVSSSDFKSRIDYRLKQIQVDDGTNKMPSSTADASKEASAEGGQLQSLLSGAQKMQDGILKVDLSTFDAPQLPSKAPTPPSSTFKNSYPDSEQPAPPRPKALSSQIQPQQPTSAPYVPKSAQEQAKSYKLLVGNYSSPEEAQGLSDMLSANSSGKTHIKSYNGIYCVQVGSYSDFTKAQNLANAYRSKNYKVRVVEE